MTSLEQAKICLITPLSIGDADSFYLRIEEALSGGIRAIQFRNKQLSKRDAFQVSLKLRELTARFQAIYIVNDEIDLALASEADGVHIGQEDFPLKPARKLLGRDKIIGVSTHDLNQALRAEEGGADYIGFGAIFPTSTKEKTAEVGLRALKEIAQNVSIPVIAIGGISLSNIASVFRSGASGAAVISAVWDQDNLRDSIRRLNEEVSKATAVANDI